jgi:uncharacterized protein YegL
MTDRFKRDLIINYNQKLLCIFAIDVSGSMRGNNIQTVNKFFNDFFSWVHDEEELMVKLEVAIMQYDEEVSILREPRLLEDGELPPTLTERGSVTETVMAIEEAIKLVEDRKAFYRSTGQCYYRPWIIVMTDGEPYGNKATQADIDAISLRIKKDIVVKKYNILGVGIGDDFNTEVLNKITCGNFISMNSFNFHLLFR